MDVTQEPHDVFMEKLKVEEHFLPNETNQEEMCIEGMDIQAYVIKNDLLSLKQENDPMLYTDHLQETYLKTESDIISDDNEAVKCNSIQLNCRNPSKNEMEKRGNKRTANYTKEECWRLLDLIERFAHVIENKKTNALTWKYKKTAWQKVSVQFNAIGTQNRTWKQLRSKYEALKKETRKAAAKSRNIVLTGGGPYESNVNPLYKKIRSIIKLSAQGTPSRFDNDLIDNSTDNKSPCDTPLTIKNVNDENVIYDNFETNVQQPNNLDVQFQQPCGSLVAEVVPQALSDVQEEVTEMTGIAFTDLPSSSEVESPKDNNQSSDCPGTLKKPRHPALQIPNKKMSSAARKITPWIDSKTELTKLKSKLIQEEFNVKQKREAELHVQQLQLNEQQLELNRQQIKINELIIEKYKLEIKNLEK